MSETRFDGWSDRSASASRMPFGVSEASFPPNSGDVSFGLSAPARRRASSICKHWTVNGSATASAMARVVFVSASLAFASSAETKPSSSGPTLTAHASKYGRVLFDGAVLPSTPSRPTPGGDA